MNQKTKSAIVCIIFLIVSGCSRTAHSPYTAPGNEFSYTPPEHWVLREVPGQKYKLAFGQPGEDYTPNINVVEEYAPVPLDEYVEGNLRVMPQGYEKMGFNGFRVLSRTDFVTDSEQRGVRVVTESAMSGRKTQRQIFYFFDGRGGKKFVVTCSVLAESRESSDKLCDASMKTFKTSRA